MIKTATILNGKEIAAKHLERLSGEISELRRSGTTLTLATIQVGHERDTELYAKAIGNLLAKLGIQHAPLNLPDTVHLTDINKEINKLNQDSQVTGIMIFAPLPKHLALRNLQLAIDFSKDVESHRSRTLSQIKSGEIMPPTARAAIALFDETGCDATGKEALVIGRSDIVGKPVALMMLAKNATVTIAHSKTSNLKEHVQRADIVIVSVGKPGLVKGDWIKPGAIVIDVGENIVNGKLVGDVEFEKAKDRASYISPVPGGVGPVTNVMLVQNLITLGTIQASLHGNS